MIRSHSRCRVLTRLLKFPFLADIDLMGFIQFCGISVGPVMYISLVMSIGRSFPVPLLGMPALFPRARLALTLVSVCDSSLPQA